MYIVIIVFALVIIVVFLLRRLPFDYSFLISVGVGAAVNIIGLLVGSLKFDLSISVGSIIFMSIICAVITMASDFMLRVLDYTAIEHVQFEDDDFYYYVKAVPKIKISMTNHNIRVLSPGDDDVSEGEAYPDDEDYVSAYSEQAPGYDLYSDYDDEPEPEPEEEENLAMQYAMSDVEGDYEADYEEDMTDETDFDETGYDEAGYDDSGYTETGYDDSDYDRN